MSALARWFHQRNIAVAGYDRTPTVLTNALMEEGIDIHYQDNLELIPSRFKVKDNTLVIFTPAVPASHKELLYFQQENFSLKKRSEVLGMISRGHFTVAVAGTHGKTTTSSMVTHLLAKSSGGCSAFVGGIMTNYNSNLIVGDEAAPVVAEADEFDRSFLRLSPNYSILTSLDPDHLDIYGDEDQMESTYLEFLSLNDKEGQLLLHTDTIKKFGKKLEGFNYQSFGLESADVTASNLRVADGYNLFDYHGKEVIKDIRLQLPGYHNISNALAAITVALDLGMTTLEVKEAMSDYLGVKRRFEYQYRGKDTVYIDDYAHHPSEIEALLSSVRFMYPGKKITTVFQPHLYSRTRDFQAGFSKSLSLSDEVILLPIYPARELPIPGVTSEIVLKEIKSNKQLLEKEDFPEVIDRLNPEILLTVGAGDIDQLVPKIKAYLGKREGIEV